MNTYKLEKTVSLDQPWSEVGEITSKHFSTAVCIAKGRDNTGAKYWRAQLIARSGNANGLGRTKVYCVERNARGRWRAVEVKAV